MNQVTTLLLYFLAAYGLAYVVGQSRISFPFRQAFAPKVVNGSRLNALRVFALSLIECPACFGFWEGFASGFFLGPRIGLAKPMGAVVFAFATCAANLVMHGLSGAAVEPDGGKT